MNTSPATTRMTLLNYRLNTVPRISNQPNGKHSRSLNSQQSMQTLLPLTVDTLIAT
jgi:hypothetical protein